MLSSSVMTSLPETNLPKKPKRRRTIILILVALVIAIPVIYGVIWKLTGTPMPQVDYMAKAQELVESYQTAEGENGWPLVMQAMEMMESVELSDEVIALLEERQREMEDLGLDYPLTSLEYFLLREEPIPDDRWIRPERKVLELMQKQGIKDLLERGASAPRMIRQIQGNPLRALFAMNSGNLDLMLGLKRLASVRVAEMQQSDQRGDHEQMMRAFEQALAIGRATGSQSSIIERLVGHSIVALTLGELRIMLQESTFDEAILEQFRSAMDRQLKWPPARLVLETERLFQLDYIQGCYTDNGHGDGHLDTKKFSQYTVMNIPSSSMNLLNKISNLGAPGRKLMTDTFNELYQGMIKNSQLSLYERETELQGFDCDAFVENLPQSLELIKITAGGIKQFLRSEPRQQSKIKGVYLLMAIRKYEARHGFLPNSLDDLIPDILKQPILDPINKMSFVYRLSEDKNGDPQIVLYSIAVDGIDNSTDADLSDLSTVPSFSRAFEPPYFSDMLITIPRFESDNNEMFSVPEDP